MSESESGSQFLLDIPASWFIGIMMALGAILGFSEAGLGEFTAWAMAAVAVAMFVYPYTVGR